MADKTYVFCVGQIEDGSYLAYRDIEPVFCIPCLSEQEAISTAQASIDEYERLFLRKTTVKASTVTPYAGIPAHRVQGAKAFQLEVA